MNYLFHRLFHWLSSQKIIVVLKASKLSPRSFRVLHFPFRAMIHFQLIFVKAVRCKVCVQIPPFSLHVGIQLFQHYLLKRQFLLHFITFALLSKSQAILNVSLSLSSIFCSIDLFVYSFAKPHSLYYRFIESFNLTQCQSSTLSVFHLYSPTFVGYSELFFLTI